MAPSPSETDDEPEFGVPPKPHNDNDNEGPGKDPQPDQGKPDSGPADSAPGESGKPSDDEPADQHVPDEPGSDPGQGIQAPASQPDVDRVPPVDTGADDPVSKPDPAPVTDPAADRPAQPVEAKPSGVERQDAAVARVSRELGVSTDPLLAGVDTRTTDADPTKAVATDAVSPQQDAAVERVAAATLADGEVDPLLAGAEQEDPNGDNTAGPFAVVTPVTAAADRSVTAVTVSLAAPTDPLLPGVDTTSGDPAQRWDGD